MSHSERQALCEALGDWRRACWRRYVTADPMTVPVNLDGYGRFRQQNEAHLELLVVEYRGGLR